MEGLVVVQTNETQNAVIAFGRDGHGSLTRLRSYETGGAGDAEPHMASQGSVVFTADGRHVVVTNTASEDVTVFTMRADGTLATTGPTPAGPGPTSVAVHRDLLYVLATGSASVVGLRMGQGELTAISHAEYPLSAPDCDPAQVGFTRDGSALVVTERGTDSIVSFPVHPDGTLGARQVTASSGPTPYGFAFTGRGTLVVTEAFAAEKGAAAASSYAVHGAAIMPVSKSVKNGRSEICWAVVTPDDRSAFTTNFADGAVSRYAIGADGALTLGDPTAGLSVDGRPGLRDVGLTGDGRYLYALDADAGQIFGWAVGEGGRLSPIGSWDGLPATVAGLAAR